MNKNTGGKPFVGNLNEKLRTFEDNVTEYRLKEHKRWGLSRYHEDKLSRSSGSESLGFYDNLGTAISIMEVMTKSEPGATNNSKDFDQTLTKEWVTPSHVRIIDKFIIDGERELIVFEGATWMETHEEVSRWVEMTNRMLPREKHYKVEPLKEMVGAPRVVAVRLTWDEIEYPEIRDPSLGTLKKTGGTAIKLF